MSLYTTYPFSTYDNDNYNCAETCGGGGWYGGVASMSRQVDCCEANPNGKYYPDSAVDATPHGMLWNTWKGSRYSMKTMQMKLRRTPATDPTVV